MVSHAYPHLTRVPSPLFTAPPPRPLRPLIDTMAAILHMRRPDDLTRGQLYVA